METASALNALGALAQETRLRIFRLLVEQGAQGLAAGSIGKRLELAPATLSFHIKSLAAAGLLSSRQRGRFVYYATDFGAMRALVAYLTENCCRADAGNCGPACAADCAALQDPGPIVPAGPKPTIRPKRMMA